MRLLLHRAQREWRSSLRTVVQRMADFEIAARCIVQVSACRVYPRETLMSWDWRVPFSEMTIDLRSLAQGAVGLVLTYGHIGRG